MAKEKQKKSEQCNLISQAAETRAQLEIKFFDLINKTHHKNFIILHVFLYYVRRNSKSKGNHHCNKPFC